MDANTARARTRKAPRMRDSNEKTAQTEAEKVRLVDWVTEGVCDMPVRAEVTRHTRTHTSAGVSRPDSPRRGVEIDVLETNER